MYKQLVRLLPEGRKNAVKGSDLAPPPPLTARQATFLILRRKEELNAEEQQNLDALRHLHPDIELAYDLVQQFAQMLRTRTGERLDDWLCRVRASQIQELQTFVTGVEHDKPAVVAQSGSTLDASYLTRGGTRTMKQIMFLAVMQVIRLRDNEWARLYERLVKARCPFDERTQSYTGKTRVIGRVAGQMIEAIYALLMRDAELLSHVPQGQEPPPPLLYDAEVHQRHRQGHYRPLKSMPPPNVITITQLSLSE